MEIEYENHQYYRRFFVELEEFKKDFFEKNVKSDIENLPHCTIMDSLERHLDIYEKADLNFRSKLNKNDINFSENLFEIGNIYGESIIYLNKRKIEYIKEEITLFKTKETANKNNYFEFENNFNDINSQIIYEFFCENLINKKFINEDQLKQFLKYAFEKRELISVKININTDLKTKSNFKKIFYDFYTLISGRPHGKKAEYVKLISDYFIGFDFKKVHANFNK